MFVFVIKNKERKNKNDPNWQNQKINYQLKSKLLFFGGY